MHDDCNMRNYIAELSKDLGSMLLSCGATVTVAESCTGGGLASAITEIDGSSKWFGVGFVTYSDLFKHKLLKVPTRLIQEEGSVSEAVVRSMVEGAVNLTSAEYGLAVSGIAGPTGGRANKPVGTVWFAWKSAEGTDAKRLGFSGDRGMVRAQAIEFSLKQLLHIVKRSNTV